MYQAKHLEYFGNTKLPHLAGYRRSKDLQTTQAPNVEHIAVEYDDDFSWFDRFDQFINSDRPPTTTGIVVGMWDSEAAGETSAGVVETLVAAKDRLPALKAIFIGDISYDENEISWIEQDDLSALFAAFPNLEHLCIRGGNGLALSGQHANLKTLVIQSGGLAGNLVREVLASSFPSLEHLELWLGTANYGATSTIEDLTPLLRNDCFPTLHYLGLRDSDLSDEIAQALIGSPVFKHIKVLDLSLGILSDVGGEALLQEPAIKALEFLDLHHHYLSDAMMQHIKALGVEVDIDGQEKAEEYRGVLHRYVAVGE